MKYARHGHSVCHLRDKFLVVTGSRCNEEEAYRRCEQYNIDLDVWFKIPDLNVGRYYHSSCPFNDQYVFVFCGIAQHNLKYCNSIERYDSANKSQPWIELKFPKS